MFQNHISLRTFGVLAFSFLLLLTYFPKTTALVISPPIIDLNIDRGQSYSGEFSVIFKQDDPETFYLYIRKLDFEDLTNNQVTTEAEKGEQTLANWTTLDYAEVKKPAIMGVTNGDNVAPVKYTVTIPTDAPSGAHYAQIIVSQKSPEDINNNTQVALGAEVGYQILVNLKGDREYDTKLVSFRTKDNINIFPTLPVNFETTFKNDGNVYVTPNANIEIFSNGTKVDNVTLNPKFYRIFPGKTKTYENIWSEENIEEMTDEAKIETTISELPTDFFGYVSYELRHFRIGLYKADLAGFAGAQAPFKSSVTFLVIPYHLLIVVVTILGLFYLVYIFGRRGSYPKKQNRNAKR